MENLNLDKEYRPIKYDFYDQLETAVRLRQSCEIIYRDDSGKEHTVHSLIKDIYTDDGVTYARLDHFQTISLDQIIRVTDQTENGLQS